jgi:hypothetical protein
MRSKPCEKPELVERLSCSTWWGFYTNFKNNILK